METKVEAVNMSALLRFNAISFFTFLYLCSFNIGTSTNMNVEINDNSDPRNTSDLPTTIIADEPLSIQCGEIKTGMIGDPPHSVLLNFVNLANQDVTITDCDTEFDAKLFLIDSDGMYIQNQSTNHCDGNDCEDTEICSIPNRETFTMKSLDAGTYTLKLTPYSYGGSWTMKVICSTASIYTNILISDNPKC